MALTAAEIAELINQLEALGAAGGGLRELRGALTDLSNADLDELRAGLDSTAAGFDNLNSAITAQTASNNASIASLEARVRALRSEAAAYEGTTQEIDKQIKAQKAALELAKEEQRVRGGSFANIQAQEEALKRLTDKKQELTEKGQ